MSFLLLLFFSLRSLRICLIVKFTFGSFSFHFEFVLLFVFVFRFSALCRFSLYSYVPIICISLRCCRLCCLISFLPFVPPFTFCHLRSCSCPCVKQQHDEDSKEAAERQASRVFGLLFGPERSSSSLTLHRVRLIYWSLSGLELQFLLRAK